MSVPDYTRPPLDVPVYYDSAGAAIPYGQRWDFGSGPPEDTYSVTAHPQRFAPLVAVAEALIRYLDQTYAVTISDGLEHLSAFERPNELTTRAVQVTPLLETALPLTFAFTSFPGVVLRSGFFSEETFPSCGCDACDDDLADCAEKLENAALGAATGLLRESVEKRRGRMRAELVPWRPMGTASLSALSQPSVLAKLSAGLQRLRDSRPQLVLEPGGEHIIVEWRDSDGSLSGSSGRTAQEDDQAALLAFHEFYASHPEGPQPWPTR
ncbi:MAG: DUF6226 family protein [Propionibacteriaceae bacterium]|jgi:hypothetical protein|nr:DUF6226 family protein [Propionibacteriaceae bacterium]